MAEIIQGTTPTITYAFDFDWDMVESLTATFESGDQEILKFEKDRFTFLDGTISTKLTQEETLKFPSTGFITQLKIKDTTGNVLASNIVRVSVKKVLDEVEL